jgi:aromatic-L-amino-acid decarboxylase
MKLFADTPVRRTLQVLADLLFVAWLVLWVWAGNAVHDGTLELAGLREHIRSGVALAEHVAGLVAVDDRFEMVTEPVLSLVVFRLRAGDEATMAAMEAVNASGEAYLSHTTVNGRAAMRLAVGSWRTTKTDVDRTWSALREAAGEG